MFICGTSGEKLGELYGTEKSTTNNRMEMTAALRALTFVDVPSRITIYTDSQYLINGITKWIPRWKQRNWKKKKTKKAKGKRNGGVEVANRDLWEQLDAANAFHEHVEWSWIKGHAASHWNHTADRLAKTGAKEAQSQIEIELDKQLQGPYYDSSIL